MFRRDTTDPNTVVIEIPSHHRRFESQMGRYDRWHAMIVDDTNVIVVSWNTGLPYVGVEVYDLEDDDNHSGDQMFHQESGVYESLPNWDEIAQESDERIGLLVWDTYQHYMIV